MRLCRGIHYGRAPFCKNGSHNYVFGSRDACFIEENIGSDKFFGVDFVTFAFDSVIGTKLSEAEEMRVKPSSADDVSSRRRKDHFSVSRKKRTCEKNRSPHLSAEVAVKRLVLKICRIYLNFVFADFRD